MTELISSEWGAQTLGSREDSSSSCLPVAGFRDSRLRAGRAHPRHMERDRVGSEEQPNEHGYLGSYPVVDGRSVSRLRSLGERLRQQ